jgi:O-methyltransferase involved in polyketide biosynthesis
MPKIAFESQNPIAETLLIPLHARAVETRRPDPMLRDEKALAMMEQIDYDFGRFKLASHDQATMMMRLREFDRFVRDFLDRHPAGSVVHIGCGLDTRFGRVDNGQVRWYELDLPEVIALRRQLIPESERCRYLACSVLDKSWLDAADTKPGSPVLFVAEAVFPYFEEVQVKSLFLTLMERLPGSELVCDGFTPLLIWLDNVTLATSKVAARLRWGLRHGRDPETWAEGIRLLDEWFYFDRPEPRLGAMAWMRYFPPFGRGVGIFHYRLGEAR